LLTAWSTAGVLGPLIVNAIADHQISAGIVGPDRYSLSFTIMIALLLVAVVCNELIRTPKPPNDEQARTTAGVAADSVASRRTS
jgi:hypothetical protein